MKTVKLVGLLVLLLFTLAFPWLFPNPAVTTIAVFTLMFAAAATGWNILSGYTGYVALGHAAFFGIGAYALALMCQDWNIAGGYGPFLLVPVAGLIAAVASIFYGWIALRVRRHTFIVITIAMFFITQLLSYNLGSITNGSTGLGLPIPTDWGGYFFNTPFYYATFVVLVFAVAVSWWIRHSKFGLGLLAIRDDEDRAMGLGVRTGSSKLIAFVISAFIVAMIGALWAYFVESIYPASTFDPNFDVAIALMAFLGGLGTLSGPLLGALILEPTQQYFILQYGENGYYLIVYGAIFLIVIILMPRGIIPSIGDRLRKMRELRQQESEGGVAISALAGNAGKVVSRGDRNENANRNDRDNGEATPAERKEGINL